MGLLDTLTQKKPFDATLGGMILNFFKATPQSTKQVLGKIGQTVARSIGSAAVSATKPLGGQDQVTVKDVPDQFKNMYLKVFGSEPVKSLETRIAENEIKIQQNPVAKKIGVDKYALPLAFWAVIGDSALNVMPTGSPAKSGIKALAQSLLKIKTAPEAARLLLRFGIPNEVLGQFPKRFAEANTPELVQGNLELLNSAVGTYLGKLRTSNVTDAITRLRSVLQAAKPKREILETAYSAKRSEQAGVLESIFSKQGGRTGFTKALGTLKGELVEKRPDVLPISLQDSDVHSLFNAIQSHGILT